MIYVTGDMHGDPSRWKAKALKKLRKKDTLIICGDFGFLWDGDKKEQKFLKWIGKRPYHVLFVEGCHENYDLLEQYPITDWAGGKVRVISGNLMQLMRGEIFQIENKTVFAFGGGDLTETSAQIDLDTAQGREQPTKQETGHGLDRLKEYRDHVDIIITHDAPVHIKHCLDIEKQDISFLSNYFEIIGKMCTFDKWFFGKYHRDKRFTNRFQAVFHAVMPVEDVDAKKKGR